MKSILTIDSDRVIRKDKWSEAGDGAFYHTDKKKGLLKKKENNIDLFLENCVVYDQSQEIDVSELFKAYDDFCQERNLPTYSIQEFLTKLELKKIEYDGTTAKGVKLSDNFGVGSNGHKRPPKREIFYLEKKRRFGKNRYEPVYLHIGGLACNVGFDDLISYIQTNNNEMVAADEYTIGRLLGSSFSIGSKFGRDLKLETVEKMAKISVILNIILILVLFIVLMSGGGFDNIQWTIVGG